MSYTAITATGTTTFPFTRKASAVKAGLATGESFTVATAKGTIVHTHEVAPVEAPAKAVKVCKKDGHGEHRVTRTGSYCRACDLTALEAQKAERAAAKAAS